MADFEKAGWYFAFGNLMLFSLVSAISLALENPNAAALFG